MRVLGVQAGSQPQASRHVLISAPCAGTVFHSMEAPNLQEGQEPGPLLPLHPLPVSYRSCMLWGHVDPWGHGGVAFLW